MAEAAENNPQSNADSGKKKFDISTDERLRYIGFDVGPAKVGELYKNKDEEKQFVEHVREKESKFDVFRDTSNFRETRLSGAEKIVLAIASVAILLVFFLPFTPMIAGYVETRTEAPIKVAGEEPAPPAAEAQMADSMGAAGVDQPVGGTAAGTAATDTAAAAAPTKTRPLGFQSLQTQKTRIKIDRTPYHWSALALLTSFGSYSGDLFSSGFAIVLSAILMGLYVLLCLLIPIYILMKIFTLKGSPDEVAIGVKKALKVGWVPFIVFVLMILSALVGGDYGFSTEGALKQFGGEYSISALAGLLGGGFFITLGGFALFGAKSMEI